MEDHIKSIILALGEDPSREGLKKTPERVAKSFSYLTSGYSKDPKKVLNGSVFTEDIKDMVIVKDIEFYSLCEHHMLPFYGRCHIGYIPNGKIVGLSKIPRIVEVFARRLQVQERLTREIAESINGLINPVGFGIVMEASHLCMMMRGIEKQSSSAITSCMFGLFKKDQKTRSEFLELIGHK